MTPKKTLSEREKELHGLRAADIVREAQELLGKKA